MTVDKPDARLESSPDATDGPAVGFVVTPATDGDAVAGAVLRARRAGHDVLVGAIDATDGEPCAFARALGARVIDVPRTADEPRAVLARRAREAGYPGLVWQSDPTRRIDFARSAERVRSSDDYCVAPVDRPTVEPSPHVLVAIPAYDEAESIADVVTAAEQHADEVLVIDDGSDDDTAERARAAGATVIEHDSNRGYGAALKTAFQEADRSRADHLVILDGDGQHDPADVPAFVRAQREADAELVVGTRFGPETDTRLPLYRRVGLAVVNAVTNLSMGVVRPSRAVGDTQCGFRAYDRRAIHSLATEAKIGDHMGASTDVLHHAHLDGFDVVELPTTVDYDVADASTRTPIDHGVTLIMNLVRTIERERPISVLGVPGVGSTLVGVGFAYWTMAKYIQHGEFPLGLALTSTFFALVGVFACFTAIILHSLNQRRD